tara:strand:+ start:2021 stop:2509 length:489 start_codon:yes stop_codon:yes gene_type:complete
MASILKTDKIEGVTASGTVQMPAGHVIQTVFANTSTNTTISTSSYVDTTITATITPKFSASKVLVLTNMAVDSASNNNLQAKLFRDSTELKLEQFWGYFIGDSGWYKVTRESHMYLDSPSSTSALVYKWQARLRSGVNTSYWQWDDSNGETDSQIILQEIAQ